MSVPGLVQPGSLPRGNQLQVHLKGGLDARTRDYQALATQLKAAQSKVNQLKVSKLAGRRLRRIKLLKRRSLKHRGIAQSRKWLEGFVEYLYRNPSEFGYLRKLKKQLPTEVPEGDTSREITTIDDAINNALEGGIPNVPLVEGVVLGDKPDTSGMPEETSKPLANTTGSYVREALGRQRITPAGAALFKSRRKQAKGVFKGPLLVKGEVLGKLDIFSKVSRQKNFWGNRWLRRSSSTGTQGFLKLSLSRALEQRQRTKLRSKLNLAKAIHAYNKWLGTKLEVSGLNKGQLGGVLSAQIHQNLLHVVYGKGYTAASSDVASTARYFSRGANGVALLVRVQQYLYRVAYSGEYIPDIFSKEATWPLMQGFAVGSPEGTDLSRMLNIAFNTLNSPKSGSSRRRQVARLLYVFFQTVRLLAEANGLRSQSPRDKLARTAVIGSGRAPREGSVLRNFGLGGAEPYHLNHYLKPLAQSWEPPRGFPRYLLGMRFYPREIKPVYATNTALASTIRHISRRDQVRSASLDQLEATRGEAVSGPITNSIAVDSGPVRVREKLLAEVLQLEQLVQGLPNQKSQKAVILAQKVVAGGGKVPQLGYSLTAKSQVVYRSLERLKRSQNSYGSRFVFRRRRMGSGVAGEYPMASRVKGLSLVGQSVKLQQKQGYVNTTRDLKSKLYKSARQQRTHHSVQDQASQFGSLVKNYAKGVQSASTGNPFKRPSQVGVGALTKLGPMYGLYNHTGLYKKYMALKKQKPKLFRTSKNFKKYAKRFYRGVFKRSLHRHSRNFFKRPRVVRGRSRRLALKKLLTSIRQSGKLRYPGRRRVRRKRQPQSIKSARVVSGESGSAKVGHLVPEKADQPSEGESAPTDVLEVDTLNPTGQGQREQITGDQKPNETTGAVVTTESAVPIASEPAKQDMSDSDVPPPLEAWDAERGEYQSTDLVDADLAPSEEPSPAF